MQNCSIEEQREFDRILFPLTFSPTSESTMTLANLFANTDVKNDILNSLKKHKALLFRGFAELRSAEDFHNVVEAINLKPMAYLGTVVNDTILKLFLPLSRLIMI